jgi:aldehyde dehydrogenase (NAD+)
MSANSTKFYIDGQWVKPAVSNPCDVINPATEETAGQISLGSSADVDQAVAAARRAFPAYSTTTGRQRLRLLRRIIRGFEARSGELANAMTAEMGSPITFSNKVQTVNALADFKEMISVLKSYKFERFMGGTLIRREPIGVCGLITPWNWPLNQITSKLAPALAAGCTAVLTPSEIAPLSAIIFTEILPKAGVSKGVLNLVNGDGPTVGEAISGHPDIDMVSFTGLTRAGILVAKAAANSVKRVTQELGGKSANIILPDADLGKAIPAGVLRCFTNTGQSCQAPTRMLVHGSQRDAAVALAKQTAEGVKIGDPLDPGLPERLSVTGNSTSNVCEMRYSRRNTAHLLMSSLQLRCISPERNLGGRDHDHETSSSDRHGRRLCGSIDNAWVDRAGAWRDLRGHSHRCRVAEATDSRSVCRAAHERNRAAIHEPVAP